MSVHGSKRKEVPILSYELQGNISDDCGPIRWSNSHVLKTLAGTFTITLHRRFRLRDIVDIKRFGNSLFIGGLNIDYENPDFTTYMTDDAEMLDRQIRS